MTSNLCKNETYRNVELVINKEDKNSESFPSFNTFGLVYNIELNKSQSLKESISLSKTNKKYNSVYYFEDGVNAYNSGNGYLKSFYWDKKEGLIRYDTSDDEVFELFKIIK